MFKTPQKTKSFPSFTVKTEGFSNLYFRVLGSLEAEK